MQSFAAITENSHFYQMFATRMLSVLSLVHLLYLMDVIQRRPLHRRYLKLYRDWKFFRINIAIAFAFILIKAFLIPAGQVSLCTAPMVFILLSRLLIKHSILRNGKPFIFLHRGDLVKGSTADHVYSFLLLAGSLVLGILCDYLWTTYY